MTKSRNVPYRDGNGRAHQLPPDGMLVVTYPVKVGRVTYYVDVRLTNDRGALVAIGETLTARRTE